MALDIYGTATLAGVITTIKPSALGFWLNFFTTEYLFDTEEIDFDEVLVDRRIAPLVLPTVAGKPQRERGFTTKKYKPAYLKPLNTLSPSRTLSRRPGEAFGGQLSPDQRAAALLAQYLTDQRDQIERRWNKMAAEALLDGKITLAGDDYPTVTIDFGRPAAHTVVLASGSRWSDTGVDPFATIEASAKAISEASGYPADVVIMGTAAWAALTANVQVQAKLDLRRGTDKLGALDFAPGSGANVQYKGSDGSRQYWVYSELYDIDETTTGTFMDARDMLVMSSVGVQGARCFGAILDMDALRAVPIFPKSYTTENPSARYVMTQSAPMMVPGRTAATHRTRVVA